MYARNTPFKGAVTVFCFHRISLWTIISLHVPTSACAFVSIQMGATGRRATHGGESRMNGPSAGRTKEGTNLGVRLPAEGSAKNPVFCAPDDEAPGSSKQVKLHDA